MTNQELQEAGLLSTYDPNAAAPSWFDRINTVNAQILMDLSPTRRTPELSKQPQQRYGANLQNWQASKKLAEQDWLYITSLVQEHGTTGVMLKAVTCEANRWLAAERIMRGSHRLSTNDDLVAHAELQEDNYRKIEVGEAAYGKDMSGNEIARPNRNRKVTI
jgi:hypothetical protein